MSEQQPVEVETTYVKTAPSEGERVGLAEKDPAHPKTDAFPDGGECYVAGQDQEPQQVAKTAGVLDALAKKRIVEVSAAERRRASATEAAPAPSTAEGTSTPPPPTVPRRGS